MKKSALLVALLATTAALAGGRMMREGQWEITVNTEMEGVAAHMPPQTITKCFKPEDVKDPKDMLKKSSQPDCTQKDVKVEGNKVVWSVECHKNGGTQTGHGEITYAGDSYEGVMTMQLSDPRMGNHKITSHTHARRTGDCAP